MVRDDLCGVGNRFIYLRPSSFDGGMSWRWWLGGVLNLSGIHRKAVMLPMSLNVRLEGHLDVLMLQMSGRQSLVLMTMF